MLCGLTNVLTVSCSTGMCCRLWHAFALDPSGKNIMPSDSVVKSFVRMPDAISASYQFSVAGQSGTIGFPFKVAQTVQSLKVTGTFGGPAFGRRTVTLEANVGRSGCLYPLNAAGEASLSSPEFCWGGPFTPDGVNIRLEAKAAGDAMVRITRVELK